MAALTSSPSGFSYAQAAKGHTSTATSQASSSKVTSGTATPATGNFSELGPNGNWADDVEATSGEKPEARKTVQETSKSTPVKDSAVERAKSESRVNSSSGVSSPDLAATSSTTNTDESSVPNTTTSSETTWETKSQNSEPAWIAERKERQNHDKPEKSEERPRRGGKKGDKEAKEAATPKPESKPVLSLQESAPPPVNPWAKRMEDLKAKAPTPAPAKPVPAVPAVPAALPPAVPVSKENARPRVDTRKKSNSIGTIPYETESSSTVDSKKPQNKRADGRTQDRQNSKPSAEAARSEASAPAPSKAASREAQSLPNLTAAAPPPVKDETSWPTPDKAEKGEDKDRNITTAERDVGSSGDAEAAESRPREKTKWTQFAVTPNIVWETEEMNRPRGAGAERGSRGGASGRGRGGARGSGNGSKGDRPSRKEGSQSENDSGKDSNHRDRSQAADREAMPPPAKPARVSTASESRTKSQARAQSQAKTANVASTEQATSKNVTEPQRTRSPVKITPGGPDGQDVKILDGTPRPTHNQTQESREQVDAIRDTPKRQASDGKKESRNFEFGSNGKEWNGTTRGGKRGGRGRGGSREFTNGHQASQPFANGHAEFSGSYGVPATPSTYQSPRGAFSSHSSQPGRGGWRGNPRSQSIPIDGIYSGRFQQYGAPAQLGPVQTYYPGMYEFSHMPMSAMPYHPMVDHQYLVEMVGTQLEYYFSLDNLLKDMFLRRNMDSQGFVFLDVIGNFNRVKQLTSDIELLKYVCLHSENIEIKVGDDGKERLRRISGWEQFVLPKDQRESSAQNDGPQNPVRPQEPRMHVWAPPMPLRVPQSAGLPGSQQRRSYDAGYPMNGATANFAPFSPLPEAPYGDVPNGEEVRGRAAKSPIRENSVSPGQSLLAIADSQDIEPDVFPDEQTSTLTVVVKMQPPKPQHAASRTFSNGSIDTRSIFSELEKSNDENAKPAANGEPTMNGDTNHQNTSRHASPSLGRSPEKGVANELTLLWVKDKEVPQESLPQDATLEPYLDLKIKALNQRAEAATGACPYDMDVLYQFWSHFLIRNFNNQMYREFKLYANNDAQQRHTGTGLQNLVQFYAKALTSSNPIRDHIVKDYVELVKNEPAILQGLAFKQLRQAWRNGALNLKNRKRLTDIVDEQLRARLES